MIAVITVARIVWAFAPIARDIVDALKKKSDGGKKITPAEWEAILKKHGPQVFAEVNRRAILNRRRK